MPTVLFSTPPKLKDRLVLAAVTALILECNVFILL
uniref:Uncharacterized protein n=1 Tax=Siphoviridae sp. ctwNf2 TaxID=2827597 RepID=A0A8S5RRZ7_9CAUD|nr:MAG TPA: hypothetical protein [Siphoviridae sp. ctwNf2]